MAIKLALVTGSAGEKEKKGLGGIDRSRTRAMEDEIDRELVGETRSTAAMAMGARARGRGRAGERWAVGERRGSVMAVGALSDEAGARGRLVLAR